MNLSTESRHHVRLLTFQHLPLPFFNQPSDPFFDTICELTSRCRYFEQHYLQKNGWWSLLDSLPESMQHCVHLTVLATAAFEQPDISHHVIQQLADWQVPNQHGLHWLHIDNCAEWPEKFLDAVNAMWPADTHDHPLVITALNASSILPTNVESALPEDRIRVPLWVVDGTEPSRCQHLTGSLQLLPALMNQVSNVDQNLQPFELPKSECVFINVDQRKAVRVPDFLYVDTGQQEALYAKPTDCWNTNDVSREHLDTVLELAKLSQS